MLQYQLSMALADMHIRELVAEAERHALLAEAGRDSTATPTLTTRLRHLATRMLACFRAPREVSVHSAGTSMTGAGPIGCSA